MALKDLMFRNEIEELVHGAYHALDTPDGPATRYYSDEQIALLPEVARDWALGVGNPVPHADLQVGETVLDLGCGAGIDVLLAAHAVGPTGRVIGLDLLEEMLERGRKAAADAGADNVEFIQGKMDGILKKTFALATTTRIPSIPTHRRSPTRVASRIFAWR